MRLELETEMREEPLTHPPENGAALRRWLTTRRGTQDFLNIEDKGGWLFVRIRRLNGGSIPVRIARDAMESCFGAAREGKSLVDAYLENSGAINAKVWELDPSGNLYTTDFPMLLGASDFG